MDKNETIEKIIKELESEPEKVQEFILKFIVEYKKKKANV